MTSDLLNATWPVQRLGQALEALAQRSKLSTRPATLPLGPQHREAQDDDTLGRWIKAAADKIDLEAQPVFTSYAALEQTIITAPPALLRVRIDEETRFLLLLRRGWRTVFVLDPQLRVQRIRPSVISAALSIRVEASITPELDRLLETIGVPRRKRSQVRAGILRESLSGVSLGGLWLMRLRPGGTFTRHLQRARVLQYVGALAGTHAVQSLLWLLAWYVIGRGALSGRVDTAWLVAWSLILMTIIPLRLLSTWIQGALAIRVGGMLKQRMLYGALNLDPELIRRQGAGQLFGRIIETEAVDSLAVSGGLQGLLACIELGVAGWVVVMGAGGWLHASVLLLWVIATLFFGWRYFRKRRLWTRVRMEITNDLVERMVGHRTRLAQERREHWHESEDQSLENYVACSKVMDYTTVVLSAITPRGWLFVGLLGLGPAFVWGNSSSAALAIGLGGILLAYVALRRLVAGIFQMGDAAIAWNQVAPLFHGSSRPPSKSDVGLANDLSNSLEPGEALLDARDLSFHHPDRTDLALKHCNLNIKTGDKLLIEGPSGGGKSTLASLLVGLRQPDSGLLLLRGFDRQTLGDENWRRLVVSAPQFHENHVITETFAFNLLMGRRWPATPSDLEECDVVCRELGLGELIDRMPSGLFQMVGDTGWQLSHGERSRLFIARAILQHADLVVLDESFAALDPENLRRSLRCVLNRTPTLIVIAHP